MGSQVVQVLTRPTGFSPGVAARLLAANGRRLRQSRRPRAQPGRARRPPPGGAHYQSHARDHARAIPPLVLRRGRRWLDSAGIPGRRRQASHLALETQRTRSRSPWPDISGRHPHPVAASARHRRYGVRSVCHASEWLEAVARRTIIPARYR